MTPLDATTNEFKELDTYLQKTKGDTHGFKYEVQDIFRMERNGEFERFEQSDLASLKKSNRRLLWHGSRATNYGGILSQGLRIAPPEAPASGYMFGKGVYLADMSSKSANYCFSPYTGDIGLLMLCEAELGDPMLELTNADYMAGDRCADGGKLATWGKGQTGPKKWKDAGCINKSLKGVKMVSPPLRSTLVPSR
jgi:poly [ADP-ribose] polymerase